MTQSQKMELLRRQLQEDASESNIDEQLSKSIVLLAKEMGWTIDYIMNMDTRKFIEVSKIISDFYKEQNKVTEMQDRKMTFR